MSDSASSGMAIAGIAVLGFLGFMLYQQRKAEENIDEIVDDTKNIIKSIIDPIFNPSPDAPAYTLDVHGCRSDIQHWCPTDGFCKDIAQTCSLPPAPKVTCWDGSEALYGYLCPVDTSGLDPIVDEPQVYRIGGMCYKNGYPLNVPQGTDCADAFAVMCQRFGPGSKYC